MRMPMSFTERPRTMTRKLPDKEIIEHYLKMLRDGGTQGWVVGHQLRSVETPYGFIGSQGDRRCREMAQARILERKIENGLVYYRYRYDSDWPTYNKAKVEELTELLGRRKVLTSKKLW